MSAVRYLASVSYSEKLIEVKTVHIYLISEYMYLIFNMYLIFEYLFRRGRRVVLGKGLHNRVTAVKLWQKS